MQVPSDDEFVDAFGVLPEAEDEPWIKVVQVEDVRLSFDEQAGSISRRSRRAAQDFLPCRALHKNSPA